MMQKLTKKIIIEFLSPAYPPQIVQNKLGGIAAPVPGVSKLEYTALQLLPYYLELKERSGQLIYDGEKVTPWKAAIISGMEYLSEIAIIENKLKSDYQDNNSDLYNGEQ